MSSKVIYILSNSAERVLRKHTFLQARLMVMNDFLTFITH